MTARNLGMIAAALLLGGGIEANAQNLGRLSGSSVQRLPQGGFNPVPGGLNRAPAPAPSPGLGGPYVTSGAPGRVPVIPNHGSYYYGPDGGYSFRYGYVPSFGAGYPYPPTIVGPPTTYGGLYRPPLYITPNSFSNVPSGFQNNLGGLSGAIRASTRRR